MKNISTLSAVKITRIFSRVFAAAKSTRILILQFLTMSSDNFNSASTLLNQIEEEFERDRTLNDDLVSQFFETLKKMENGDFAIKEFTWLFGFGEKSHHIVEDKECRKVYLIDFKRCRKFLNVFMTQQDWAVETKDRKHQHLKDPRQSQEVKNRKQKSWNVQLTKINLFCIKLIVKISFF